MKVPIPRSDDLLDRIKDALTPNRLPLLIAVDGADNAGKSSLASWLAWQLGMPAVQLDLYLTNLRPIQWLTEDLDRVVARRLRAEYSVPRHERADYRIAQRATLQIHALNGVTAAWALGVHKSAPM
jgi:hypothetical protein